MISTQLLPPTHKNLLRFINIHASLAGCLFLWLTYLENYTHSVLKVVNERITEYPTIRTVSDYFWGFRVRCYVIKYISEPIRIRLSIRQIFDFCRIFLKVWNFVKFQSIYNLFLLIFSKFWLFQQLVDKAIFNLSQNWDF